MNIAQNNENIRMNINEINANPLHCSSCNYTSKDKSNFKRHIASVKHSNKMNDVIKIHQCDTCMKVFNSRQVLHTHNKSCSVKQPPPSIQSEISPEIINIIQNQNEMIAKQSEMVMLLHQQISELKTTIASAPAPVVQNIVYDSSRNVVNTQHVVNNIQFNLNTYLNDTCSEALNFNETLPKEIDAETVLAFDENKLTNRKLLIALMNGFWKGLPQTMKPIQATDLRRNTFYMKIDNEWLKSTTHMDRIKCEIFHLKKLCFGPIQAMMRNDKGGEGSSSRHIDALKVVNSMEELFEDCLPQLLPKTAIDRKLIGNGE